MLKLKTLKFKNIGRFIEPQEISFDKLGNLVQVDAQNNITGGSSGSGKSTVFNALDWLLGLSDLSTTVLQSRLTKETISVEGLFDWDGKEVVVHRAKKLSVTTDGVETTGSSKLSEEALDQIIGMPRNLFRQLLHKRQGEMGFFLQQTPAQMNAFLTDCLNLSSIRSKIDVIDQKTKDLTQTKDKTQSELQASQAALEATKSAQASLGEEPTTNVTEALIESWKGQLNSSKSLLELLKTAQELEKTELDLEKPKLISAPFDTTIYNALDKTCKDINNEINSVYATEKDRQAKVKEKISALKLDTNNRISVLKLDHNKYVNEIKSKIEGLNRLVQVGTEAKNNAIKASNQLKELRSGVCFTCQQGWITQSAKDQEQVLLQEIANHKIAIEKSVQALVEIENLKTEFSTASNGHTQMLGAFEADLDKELSVLIEEAKPKELLEITEMNAKLANTTELKLKERQKEDKHNADQNTENNKLMEAFFTEQRVLTEKHKVELSEVTVGFELARDQYEKCASTLKSHKDALVRYKTSMDSLKNKENDITSKVGHITSKVGQLTRDIEIAEEVKRCLKSYLSCSFDDALDSISESATKILRAVPTMANATIRLVGQKESNSGAVKDQVNAVLDNDGELEVPIKSLSGGERSAVDLAIDLSVANLIEERMNLGVNLMLLDEVFGGFDSVGIEQALEMLKTLNKRILIVEHNAIAKEFVQDRITVVRDGEMSHIQ